MKCKDCAQHREGEHFCSANKVMDTEDSECPDSITREDYMCWLLGANWKELLDE